MAVSVVAPGYTCIFEKDKECPVKTTYKLKPESLLEFCKICNLSPMNRDQNKTQFEMIMQFTMMMGDLQRKLGEATAQADIYKLLYKDQQTLNRNLTRMAKN